MPISLTLQEIDREFVEFRRTFQLRPVPALAEHVQLHPRNLLERDQRAVDRLTRSSRPQISSNPLAQLVGVTPHHPELEVRPVNERPIALAAASDSG